MAQATHLYFDHPYEPDPEERGYYWAPRFTDTRKTFGFMPEDLYSTADVARSGDPILFEELCGENGKTCVPLLKPENIAGMQGHLWSETVRTPDQFDMMVFPRMLALAERAWHAADWEYERDNATRKKLRDEDWERFANTLGYKELKRLDKLGVKYHVPAPGAIIEGNILRTNVAFPGMTVQYSMDNGKSWCDSVRNQTIHFKGNLHLRTRSADGGRLSKVVQMKTATVSGAVRNGARPLLALIAVLFYLFVDL